MYQEDLRTKIQDSLQKELQSPQFLRKFNRFKKTQSQITQINLSNPLTDDKLLHLLVSNYQNNPERKPWLMTLLLVISWKQMEHTYSRFGYGLLNRINPSDSFAPVYESYIDAFLSLKQKTVRKFILHLKDRAEYLIRKELKECKRFQGEPTQEIPTFQSLPWSFEIEQMISEWTSKGILNLKQSKLVIYRIIYEYTYNELEETFKVSSVTLRQQFHRAIKELKPYLKEKYFDDNKIFISQNRV